MASDLNIPQFGTGATPGLNAPRMQAIWTFLKAIGSGGAGSVVKADNATQLAATTPSAVGLSMLSAADKAAQQALVEGAGFDADTVDGYHTGAVGVANSLVVRNASGQLQDMADYGVGVSSPEPITANLDTIIKGGKYYAQYGAGRNFPTGITSSGFLDVTALAVGDGSTTNITVQYFVPYDNLKTFIRKNSSSGWSAWYEIFNSYSDGNGGQPPCPKPTEGTPAGGANGVGKYISETKSGNANPIYFSGLSNLSGTWILDCLLTVTATGAFITRYTGVGTGVYASSTLNANTYTLTAWRVS